MRDGTADFPRSGMQHDATGNIKISVADNPVGGHPFLVECYSRFISVQASVIFSLKVLRFISNKDVAKGCEKLRFQMLQVGFQIRSVLGVDVISIGC